LAIPASSDLGYEWRLYRNNEELNSPKRVPKKIPLAKVIRILRDLRTTQVTFLRRALICRV
jgi:hypothetical protein